MAAKKINFLKSQYDTKFIDEFFEAQPPLEFVDELKSPVHKSAPLNFGTRKEKREGEADASGIYIKEKFPDNEGLLETAYEDFGNFLKVCKVGGETYPVIFEKAITECFEAYKIIVTDGEVRILSADTEGARRALFELEDEMTKREGAYLPLGEVSRRPYIKSRVTRGFFSPTNRPPKNGDELFDDIDYYPDEYLNRLQHNGTNGLWIYSKFQDLFSNSFIKEYGEGGEKRIEKLNRVIKKCKRYGVKVYLFAIEPMGFYDWEDFHERYPEMLGSNEIAHQYPICLRSEAGREYMIESVKTLFTLAPELAGYIDITDGERFTTCSSSPTFNTCPRCRDYSRGENLAYNIDIIKEGIRRAGTGAEFVSWTYGHRGWSYDDIRDYVKNAPSDVALMQNFDDRGYEEQLGKTRQAIDYWLSYVGPSEQFQVTGESAVKYGKTLWAKMQVCCSHEVATVPYIPTPGLIFEKYKGARRYNVTGVMECWYFGNYPSIMNKASGILAFERDFDDKSAFIFDLAAKTYGESAAKSVAKAFELFEEGYRNYPINIMFSYYGPMHDGIVWDLFLEPRNNALSRTWLLIDAPVGDRMGEALWSGHNLDEVIELSHRMAESFEKGVGLLGLDNAHELTTLSKTLSLLFSGGENILKFYRLRQTLGYERGDNLAVLSKMRKIVEEEIERSREMIALCKIDKRIGYHSEAEGYKFFPAKLERRIEKLTALLSEEFPEVEERIKKGLTPLEYFEGKGAYDASLAEKVTLENGASFSFTNDGENFYLEMEGDAKDEFRFCFEHELFFPDTAMTIKNGVLEVMPCTKSHQQMFGDKITKKLSAYTLKEEREGDRVKYLIKASRKALDSFEKIIKLRVEIGDALWREEEGAVTYTLGKTPLSPEEFGFIKLK